MVPRPMPIAFNTSLYMRNFAPRRNPNWRKAGSPRSNRWFSVRLLASGMTSDAIARLLNLSPKTVRNHHYAIKSKIGAQNYAQLVWLAVGAGLVDLVDARFDVHGAP